MEEMRLHPKAPARKQVMGRRKKKSEIIPEREDLTPPVKDRIKGEKEVKGKSKNCKKSKRKMTPKISKRLRGQTEWEAAPDDVRCFICEMRYLLTCESGIKCNAWHRWEREPCTDAEGRGG